MDKIICYTDGSSRGNPGPGGWGAIVVVGNDVSELGGRESKTTNNRMELRAIIEALLKVGKTENEILLYTDSTYVVKGITSWIHGWKKNGWKTGAKADVLNKDMWQELDEAASSKKISWCIVKGHAGIPANERVDEIATLSALGEDENMGGGESGRNSGKLKLFKGSLRDYGVNVNPPSKEVLENAKGNDRRKAKAYSYLSLVDGKVQRHETWGSCEARVKGKTGAKYRKSISKEDEVSIMKEWGFGE